LGWLSSASSVGPSELVICSAMLEWAARLIAACWSADRASPVPTGYAQDVGGGDLRGTAHTRKVSFPLCLSRGPVGNWLRGSFARRSFRLGIIAHFLGPFKGCLGLIALQKPCDRLSSGGPQPSLSHFCFGGWVASVVLDSLSSPKGNAGLTHDG
jgi:hypothetical protein